MSYLPFGFGYYAIKELIVNDKLDVTPPLTFINESNHFIKNMKHLNKRKKRKTKTKHYKN